MTRHGKSRKAKRREFAARGKRTVPLNRDKYSEKSKQSEGWYHLPPHYEDIHYSCSACRKVELWTCEEQKSDFEIKKLYMWTGRVLCRDCYSRKMELRRSVRGFQQKNKKRMLTEDNAKVWLEQLKESERLGARANPAIKAMLRKKLKQETLARKSLVDERPE